MSEKTRYPLCWPEGWKRIDSAVRIRAQFRKEERQDSAVITKSRLTVADSIGRVALELRRMGVEEGDIIVSTNLPLNIYGIPRADRGEPGDPGVAVYWIRRKQSKAMASISTIVWPTISPPLPPRSSTCAGSNATAAPRFSIAYSSDSRSCQSTPAAALGATCFIIEVPEELTKTDWTALEVYVCVGGKRNQYCTAPTHLGEEAPRG